MLWFWVDAISCIPLECIFYDIAPHVYWYNIPKFIRYYQRRCKCMFV